MAEQFPSTLQQYIEQAGFSYSLGSQTIRSETETGPAKVRRIYTKAVNKLTGTITIHKDDYETLINFYNDTLAGGAKTFYYNHPITGEQKEYRFLTPPELSSKGGQYFTVNLQWEEML